MAVPDVLILARSVGDIKSNGRGGDQRHVKARKLLGWHLTAH
jgi:hypothetical protein